MVQEKPAQTNYIWVAIVAIVAIVALVLLVKKPVATGSAKEQITDATSGMQQVSPQQGTGGTQDMAPSGSCGETYCQCGTALFRGSGCHIGSVQWVCMNECGGWCGPACG